MNKKGQTNMIIAMVVAVIIGIVALQVVDSEVSKQIEPQDIAGETFTGSNSTYVALANSGLSSNASCNCSPYITNLTAGSVLMGNDTCNGQTVSCDYSYYSANYAGSATTRTIIGLTPVMWAVVLLTIVAVFAIAGKLG